MAKSLYLIDGHAQIYRAYFAPFRPLTSPTGEPTRATYVFCQMLLNLIRDRQPDYLVMVLDADESKLQRVGLYPQYKAHRQPPPEDLPPQADRIVSILKAARVPILLREGFEADDIIATLVRQYAGEKPQSAVSAEPFDVFIVSRDKDLEQLLGPRVSLYDLMKSEIITPETLLASKGWRPDQAIDAQILMGDSVDNVPGVRGIGPKSAATLLQKYGTVEEIVKHADELPPKQRENLLASAAQMPMVRQLVTLVNDVPIDLDLEQAACTRFTWGQARPLFEQLGFRRLVEQLPRGTGADAPAPTDDGARATAKLEIIETVEIAVVVENVPAGPAAGLREPAGTKFELINTPEKLSAFAHELAQQTEFAVDTETTDISPIDAELVGISLAWEVGRGYYVPVRSVYEGALPLELVRAKLAPLLADPSKRKVGQNLKYDLNVLRNAGLPVAGPFFDTMIASFVLNPGRSSNSLDSLAFQLFGYTKIPTADLLGKGRDQLRMDQVPIERVAQYAAEDADYTWRLRQLFAPQLEPAGLQRLFYEVEMPLVSVLTDMEYHGIRVDVDFLRTMSHELTARAGVLADRVRELAGRQFNIDSPKQLAEVLFDKLGHRVVRHTKTTRSTDADTLEELSRGTGDPIFGLLLEYRELQKLLGTYVNALPLERSRRTGRIHTSYHQTGAVTGRLSSSEPNLQNIPIRTEAGRQIRRAFVPRSPDDLLIVADYSQIELRVLAHFCEDEALIRAFLEDQDIHTFVAAQVNGVPLESVTKEMRGRAKAVNFGIIYGQTAFGLSQSTGMSRTESQAFIDGYFARYPRIREFINRCVADAKREGCVRTILGRRRPIENIDSRNASVRAQAERFAVNTVIQGSAADLMKIAMIQLHTRIGAEELPLRMLLQVHDELVCEAPRAQAEALAATVRTVMSAAMTLSVPLKVDVACGENWLEAK